MNDLITCNINSYLTTPQHNTVHRNHSYNSRSYQHITNYLNRYKRVNNISNEHKAELNKAYRDLNNKFNNEHSIKTLIKSELKIKFFMNQWLHFYN